MCTYHHGEIFVMQMGVSVGNHVGLGGLSFYFIEKQKDKHNFIQMPHLNIKKK